jgi:pimeloyl-ACP methyl ester carboxylesterase
MESWQYVIDDLSRHATVYALDLPGHGCSEKPPHDCSIEYYVRFILGFMDTFGISRAGLAGHSMGCPVCVSLAADYPERIEKIILVDPGGFEKRVSLGYRLATVPILGNILLAPPAFINHTTVKRGMRRQFLDVSAVPDDWVQAAVKHLKNPDRNDTLIKTIRHYTGVLNRRKPQEIIDKARRVRLPALIIHGRQDKVIPLDQGQKAWKLIENSELRIFDDCGHNPEIEKPKQFAEAVISFLNETPTDENVASEYAQGS